ncbi:MAG: YhcH/YjgK/YiaL family protein [Candidatus Latescibacterota bacterium]
MIVDRLENAALYYGLSPRLERALRYLQVMDPATVAPGRREIAGEQIFALVQEYDSKRPEQGIWEAHRRYLDVQYVIAGAERMGYAPVSSLRTVEENPEKDFVKLEGEGSFVLLPAGSFAILMPQDAHMPGMAVDQPQRVKKVVVKVLV